MNVMTKDKKTAGAVDVIDLSQGKVRIAGWSLGTEVIVQINGGETAIRPGLRREDVARVHNVDDKVGYDVTLPLGPISLGSLRRLTMRIVDMPGQTSPVLTRLYLRRVRLVQLRILTRFGAALMRSVPSAVMWRLTHDVKYRASIKRLLNLSHVVVASVLDPTLFKAAKNAPDLTQPITIVMPVYNAFHLLDEALDRVLRNTDLPWRLVLIEDGSTDIKVRPFLRDWVASHDADHPTHTGRVTLLENADNLGFIRSVNRGFEQAISWRDPVVLLNSDALVPAGWASRLMQPMMTGRDVATVTPMSNDAEIFTSPVICKRYDLGTGQADAIDRIAATLNPAAILAAAPTGVGFCMAIHADYLAKVPELDTTFGRGYGEEVDWCQKVRALGGRHLGAGNLFVEHRGGQSFGAADKLQLIARNNAVISKRYPGYDAEVQRFIHDDPLRSARLALGISWAGAQNVAVPIYMAHSMGGGAENYLERHIAETHTDQGQTAIVLRVGGQVRWQVELITPLGQIAGSSSNLDYILQLLAPLTKRQVIYSCGVGDPDPVELPEALLRLSEDGSAPLDVLFHDFFPVSPSYTLLDGDGIYRGTPLGHVTTDLAHGLRQANGRRLGLDEWQAAWSPVMTAARDLITFSKDSAAHVSAAYPHAASKVVVRPHALLSKVPHLRPPAKSAKRVVAVLGNIGFQKGAGLLGGLDAALRSQDARLVVVGTVDPGYPPPASVAVHGPYDIKDLERIVARYGITDWLIPSVWPETFSYTTHEALSSDLPVHAFDIGAQGAAVADHVAGNPIPFAADANLVENLGEHFRKTFEKAGASLP